MKCHLKLHIDITLHYITETHTLIRERREKKTKTHKVVKYMLSSKSHKVIMGHQTAETVKNRLAQQIV